MSTLTSGDSSVVFSFANSHQVRIVLIDGDPWFVAADVCAALGITTEQTRRLDDDERGLRSMQTPSGEQQMVIIDESGLYSLVLGCRKPEAKKFKKWVTSEVLPSIRRTGSYTAATPRHGPSEERLSDAERNNLAWLVSKAVRGLWGHRQWEWAIWRALREVTGTKNPEHFKVHQIPEIVVELQRIMAITQGLRDAQLETNEQVIKRCIRNREDASTVIREMKTVLEKAANETDAVLISRLEKWQKIALENLRGLAQPQLAFG